LTGLNIAENTLSQILVYRSPRASRISFAILVTLVIAPIGWLMVMLLWEGRSTHTDSTVVWFIVAGFNFLMFSCFLSVYKSRIEIHSNRIVRVGLFRNTELMINEIKGFRVLVTPYARTLLLLPKNPKTKRIKASLFFQRQDQLFDWLNQNLTNLDAADFQEEMTQVLNDTLLGETQEH
jgi:hypothetical protein